MAMQSGQLFEFGPYRLDTSERLLSRDGGPLSLTPKVFDTLVALVERSGRLVEKDELIQLVWDDEFIEESNLKNNVYALRKLLGQGYIETVPTRGYRFLAPVRELGREALVIEKTVTHSHRNRRRRRGEAADQGSVELAAGIGDPDFRRSSGLYSLSANEPACGGGGGFCLDGHHPVDDLGPDHPCRDFARRQVRCPSHEGG